MIWRCRVCEGVNSGTRVCTTCGTEVPHGEPLRAAVRNHLPSQQELGPTPVPPTPRRRELRDLPTPEELTVVNRDALYSSFGDIDIRPLPGGCLVSIVPRSARRW